MALLPPTVDFLFIGAPKCGTTWLTRHLAAHPGVAMPLEELHYYSRHFERGPDWYLRQFGADVHRKLLGENSNSYLTESETALPRIVAEQPDAKILCVVRNPIERAYSSYGMQIDRGRASQDIERYLDPARSPRPHILHNGLYARMLRPWYDAYPGEKILVVRFERMKSDPLGLLHEICVFLELNEPFVPTGLETPANARKKAGVPGSIKRALWWSRPMLNSRMGRRLIEGPLGRTALAGLSRPKRYPVMDEALRSNLAQFYSDDLRELQGLTGQSCDDWLQAES